MLLAVVPLRATLPQERVDVTAPEIILLQPMVPNRESLAKQNATAASACRDRTHTVGMRRLPESQVEIDRLRLIIRQFQRARFGRSAERLDPDQMAFGLEELEADLASGKGTASSGHAVSFDRSCLAAATKPPHRAPLPAHLPRIETVIPAPHETCPDCAGTLHDAGATSSEMLDWIPAQIRVVRITRPKRACRCCGTLHQAPAPERVLAGGLATPGLIAHVLVSRYCDHLPLYRQSRSSPGTGWRSAAPPCRAGSAPPAGGWRHCTSGWSPTSWRATGCLPTTPPAGARSRPGPDQDRTAVGLHPR